MKNNTISEHIPAMPKEINIDLGFESANRVMNQLYNICKNAKANAELYNRLEYAMDHPKGGDYTVEVKGLNIYLTKDISLPVRLYLNHESPSGKRTALGSYRSSKRKFSSSKLTITLGLYGDPAERYVAWFPAEYEQTLDHEVTHAYQKLEVANRSIKMKNKSSQYKPSDKELGNELKRVSSRPGSGKILDKAKSATSAEENLRGRIEYYKRKGELGANAHALMRQLVKFYGTDSMEILGNHLSFGKPSFDEIDKSLLADSNFKSTIWYSLTSLAQHEQKIFGIRNLDQTEGYNLKKELLKLVYDYYKRYYNNRRK